MSFGIGIDTGGTYTDAVIYDFDSHEVLAKGKSRTTKEDLSKGISGALDLLPIEMVQKAEMVSLSTTLATNACVEGKGGRAKLVLMGTPQRVLTDINAEKGYGLRSQDVLCLNTKSSFHGDVVDHPDWDVIMEENAAWFADAKALAICEANAARNGAVMEKLGKKRLKERYSVPFVLGSELSHEINMMARGATALLNGRLLPVIEEFLDATTKALAARGINCPVMIVRSDGSLMGEKRAVDRPVETILSGPAASIHGSRSLADLDSCLIVDMGGTTTDVSLVENGKPVTTKGIRIGNWRTQAKGVFIETFGLGGDTHIKYYNGMLTLEDGRVEPISAAFERWPQLMVPFKELLARDIKPSAGVYEVLYMVRDVDDLDEYSEKEQELIQVLREGPVMLCDKSRIDVYTHDSRRLESEGIVMRAGLTPTDLMHIKGDFDRYDPWVAKEVVKLITISLVGYYADDDDTVMRFCDDVYDMVEKRMYGNLVKILIQHRYPKAFPKGEVPALFDKIIDEEWKRANGLIEADSLFDMNFGTVALVGIGAPIHIFLPKVASALGAECIIPPNAEVANAVGAIVANINAVVTVTVDPINTSGGVVGYRTRCEAGNKEFMIPTDAEGGSVGQQAKAKAIEAAKAEAERLAREEARLRGVTGDIEVSVKVEALGATNGFGVFIDTGTNVIATAIEKKTGA